MVCEVAGVVVDETDCCGGSEFGVEETLCNLLGGQVGHGDATYCQGTRPTGQSRGSKRRGELERSLGALVIKDPVRKERSHKGKRR